MPQERQDELEALDLAVEEQKEVCQRLSVEESEILEKLRRTRSAGDLESILATARLRASSKRFVISLLHSTLTVTTLN